MKLRHFVLALGALVVSPVTAHAEGPTYHVDPDWRPKIPEYWALGSVSSVAVDDRDHVWILQRPSSLSPDELALVQNPSTAKCCRPAPPVIETDREGNVLRAWGGPGEGYDWPTSEHGIFVDHEGNVWIAGAGPIGTDGPNDGMVLKFTGDGKFIKQLGGRGSPANSLDRTMFGKPTAFDEDPEAREIYVADGYVNHRVVVLDADTLEVKRLWGAYGKPPTDLKLENYDTDSPQFNTVHCVSRAPDGLIYVCDRVNNRIQVFHSDGTYVRQFVFEPATRGAGSVWGAAVSPRDPGYVVMVDGGNKQMSVWRRSDGTVLHTFGRQGRYAGQFHWVHALAINSHGDVFTAEVDDGKRVQKWVREP